MSEENKVIARRWVEELWGQGNADVADEIIAADYVAYDPGLPDRPGGVEGEKNTVAMFRSVFPDLRFTIEDIIASGDRVVVCHTAYGTHRGDLGNIRATDREAVIPGVSILRIEGGKIVELRISWDRMGMFEQLGLVPPIG
jgi:predicted ester cyclase